MESADSGRGSKPSVKQQQQQTVRFPSSDLCLTCTLPCSETEWKFSIEDGLAGSMESVSRFKGESVSQGKNGKEKKIINRGRVLYRRPVQRVPCP